MLKLSKMTDYAVVVLAELSRGESDLLSVSQLSGRTGLPEPTVSKIMKTLGKSDFVASVRGPAGGYRLSRPADEVSLTAIITAMEGPVALVACVGHSPDSCRIESHCAVKGRWETVNRAIKSVLDGMSLSDMVPQAKAGTGPVTVETVSGAVREERV